MVFCVIADGNVKDIKSLPECDVALFGFNGLGEVDYESELKGYTDKFEDATRLSKTYKCGVLCGCRTKSRGVIRKSVSVADRGKLLGISDMNNVIDKEEFKSGAGLGVYNVGGYKIGVCIENDLLFPDGIKAQAMCGCNVIAVVMEELKSPMPPVLIRAYSYLYGVPIIMCAGNMAYFSEITGDVASSSLDFSLFDVNMQNSYHVVTSRTKGIYTEVRNDY